MKIRFAKREAVLGALVVCATSARAHAIGPLQHPSDLGETVLGGDPILRFQAGGPQGPAEGGPTMPGGGALASPFSSHDERADPRKRVDAVTCRAQR